MFSKGAEEPVKFNARREKKAIIDWLNENAKVAENEEEGDEDEKSEEEIQEL